MVAGVKALACELPAKSDVPLAKWSCPDLAVEAARRQKFKPAYRASTGQAVECYFDLSVEFRIN